MDDDHDWRGIVFSAASLTLAAGLYAWVMGGAVPASLAESGSPQADPLRGLGTALLIGAAAALFVTVLTRLVAGVSPWPDRLVWAAGGLYFAGAASAVGSSALVLAAAAMIGHLVFQAVTGKRPRVESLLLVLHTGGFGTALCFFHQWPRYASGWVPFLRNFKALTSLWF